MRLNVNKKIMGTEPSIPDGFTNFYGIWENYNYNIRIVHRKPGFFPYRSTLETLRSVQKVYHDWRFGLGIPKRTAISSWR